MNIVCDSISKYLHNDYLLVKSLRKGVVYHHGSVPEIVRLYIERAYTEITELRHIICNSTLLEGVNIPAEKMFILDVKKGLGNLTRSQFKNLVGRVCRFSEIFNGKFENLSLLEPEIYLVLTNEYYQKNGNIHEFIEDVAKVDKKNKDDNKNVLLENISIKNDSEIEKKEADEFLENLMPGTTGNEVEQVHTVIGKLCYLHNIFEIDILGFEETIQKKLNDLILPLYEPKQVIELIATTFIPFLKENNLNNALNRLKEVSAQNFYAMMIDWKIKGTSYTEMIQNFLLYWDRVEDKEVYVGKWGEFAREGSHKTYWVDITQMSNEEKINLAIVRIKEEQDFIEINILKYVELLHDMGKINEDLYLNMKYGTTNHKKINLINLGVNSILAGKLIDNYSNFVEEAPDHNGIKILPALIDQMRAKEENDILIFETAMHLGLKHKFF